MMERVDEEGQTQKSSRGSIGPVGRTGAERGQKARQQGERPQRRFDQKPQEDRRGAAQCATAASWTAQATINSLIQYIRARYGQPAIGWGDDGIH